MHQEETSLFENKVSYLCNAANTIASLPGSNILKSYYLPKCQWMASASNVSLPQQLTGSKNRCFRCCIQYQDNPTSYRIYPERKKNKFIRKLIKKSKTGKTLTRYQELYLRNLSRKGIKHNNNNTLVVTCSVCKRATKVKLQKPEEQKNIIILEDTPIVPTKTKRKKRNRDRFAGLNKDVVLSLTPKNKSFATSDFIPLNLTPTPNDVSKDSNKANTLNVGKALFAQNGTKNNKSVNNQGILKGVDSKNKKMKNKKKKMKNLRNMLNNAKQGETSMVSLKQFFK